MSPRGFTLVEVLVALAIVAVGMAALLASLTSAADTTAWLREKSFAEWVAMNRLAELRLQVQPVRAGKSTGDVEFAGRRWQWEQNVVALDFPPGVNRIDVRVRAADAPRGARANWLATVSGVRGDALLPPRGDPLPWTQIPQPGGGPGGPGSPGTQPTPNNGPGTQPVPLDPEPGEPRTTPLPQPTIVPPTT